MNGCYWVASFPLSGETWQHGRDGHASELDIVYGASLVTQSLILDTPALHIYSDLCIRIAAQIRQSEFTEVT